MYVSIGCYAFSKTRWSGKKMLVLAGVIGWAGLIPEPMQMPRTSVVQAADEDTESTKAKDSKNEKASAIEAVKTAKALIDEADTLLKKGKTSGSLNILKEAIEQVETLSEMERIPTGVKGLADRIRTLKDGLELEGIDVTALKIPVIKSSSRPASNPVARPTKQMTPPGISFVTHIGPFLASRCGTCHVQGRKGDFQMASYEDLIKSKMVQKGVGNASRLVEVIASGDMPRGGGKVTPAELAFISQWIDQGAIFDGADATGPLGTPQPVMIAGASKTKGEPTTPITPKRPALKAGDISFSREIAPVLVEHCDGCHDANDAEARLRMVSLSTLQAGGTNGPTFIAGKGAGSLLVRKLRGIGIDGQRMPLGKDPLEDELIGKIEKWINQGATIDLLKPEDSLETVAAAGRSQGLSHESLTVVRGEAAEKLWKRAIPDESPESSTIKEVTVIGNMSASRTKEVASMMESSSELVKKSLGLGDAPLVKGGVVVFVFEKAYDYSNFWQNIMGAERPKSLTGHVGISGDVVYAAIVVPDEEEDASLMITEHLAAISLLARGAPDWFSRGAGRTVAIKISPKASLARAWDASVPASLIHVSSPTEFFEGGASPADVAAISGSFVSSFASTPGKLAAMTKDLDGGQPFEDAFTGVFRSNPTTLFQAWQIKTAKRFGRKS
ncbi:MAG: c-type cytochrome domain-containing protein [Planctomycetota bacterium]|jgi:mono/diheme cytochrome c family protein